MKNRNEYFIGCLIFIFLVYGGFQSLEASPLTKFPILSADPGDIDGPVSIETLCPRLPTTMSVNVRLANLDAFFGMNNRTIEPCSGNLQLVAVKDDGSGEIISYVDLFFNDFRYDDFNDIWEGIVFIDFPLDESYCGNNSEGIKPVFFDLRFACITERNALTFISENSIIFDSPLLASNSQVLRKCVSINCGGSSNYPIGINNGNLSSGNNFQVIGQNFRIEEKKLSDDIKNVEIFPNPIFDRFSIQFENTDHHFIKIFTSNGKEVKSFTKKDISKNQLEVDFSKEPRGIYFIIIYNGASNEVKRLIKL